MTPDSRKKCIDLIRRSKELMSEYEQFLLDIGESDEALSAADLAVLWPYHRTIYVERKCALADTNEEHLQLLTAPGQRSLGLKELRDFTVDAKSLIIVDPYIFSGEQSSAKQISDELKKSARIGGRSLKRIHFIYDPAKVTIAIKNSVKELLASKSVRMTEAKTAELHDRVWITDRKRGIVVGTSLNGIGKRAAFLLPLPDPDLKALLEFLDQRKLSRAES